MFTQTDIDQAVAGAEAAKDLIIAEKDATISSLNITIASMYTQTQLNQAIVDAEAAKDLIIADKDATIASMFTQTDIDQAVAGAEAAKDLIIADYTENLLYLLYGDFDMNSSVDGFDLSIFSRHYGNFAIDVDNDTDGYSEIQNDCDDTDAAINPDADEICSDGVDNNCNNLIDETCGTSCSTNADCEDNEFCNFPDCSASQGTCAFQPTACITLYDPVCGCDGNTYGNDCDAAANGVSVAYNGEC